MDIKLKQLGKRYKFEWIFRNLDFDFQNGNAYAILGANGSGKSTLLKVLSGHTSPSKGTIDFYNQNEKIAIDKVYHQLSFAAPYIELIEELTLIEVLQFHQKFKAFQNNLTVNDLIDMLNFSKSKHKEVRFFSSGMKQRLKLVLAICSDTNYLLLDEPTTNLDNQGVLWYQELIEHFAKNRLTIVASNIEHDYEFCKETLNIMDFKKK
jgi:ABC-type multidrug transport system ATPase subunit